MQFSQKISPCYQSAQTLLGNLLKAETTERDVRSVAYHMKVARFPTYRDLAGFDFAQSAVNEALVRQLHRLGRSGAASAAAADSLPWCARPARPLVRWHDRLASCWE